MKLFTIGDSLAQGFMSGAAARADLSFSTLIARALGLNPGSTKKNNIDYFYPAWQKGGLPANLENILRRINSRCGAGISVLELAKALKIINRIIDDSEDYYERGKGREDSKYPGLVPFFHNVSVWMLTVADAWLVKPETCLEAIHKQGFYSRADGLFAIADCSFYRTALKVLAPNLENNFSQLDWLQSHAEKEGIENLILWLGINNTMGTILSFEIHPTPNDPFNRPHLLTFAERCAGNWNLWHPGDFAAEYCELIERVDHIMKTYNTNKDWQVFIGTVPYLTIAPFIKGIGPEVRVDGKGAFYERYTYVFYDEDYARKKGCSLSIDQVLQIDDYVDEYNKAIRELINLKNREHENNNRQKPYHIVDICEAFNRMAWKRNKGKPPFVYPPYFKTIESPVNTKYYHTDTSGRIVQGGIFSLDGVHPSAVGQGLIAAEFMKVMEGAGVVFKNSLDWKKIFDSDTLYRKPITLMGELYRHEKLAHFFTKIVLKMARRIRAGE
jgi:hypothetical protein